jgi:hypothetical protein
VKLFPERLRFCMLVMLLQPMGSCPVSLLPDRSKEAKPDRPDHCSSVQRGVEWTLSMVKAGTMPVRHPDIRRNRAQRIILEYVHASITDEYGEAMQWWHEAALFLVSPVPAYYSCNTHLRWQGASQIVDLQEQRHETAQ